MFHLLKKNQFFWLFWVQCFGALSHNFFKYALVTLAVYRGISFYNIDPQLAIIYATVAYIVPFFLFLPYSGQLADKHQRVRIVVFTKVLELMIMLIAALLFYINASELLMLLFFLLGMQAAFFEPIKFSLIPDLTDSHELTGANSLVLIGASFATLAGVLVGIVTANSENALFVVSVGLIFTSISGLVASLQLKPMHIAEPQLQIHWNFITQSYALWQVLTRKQVIWRAAIGVAWFWFFATVLVTTLPVLCKTELQVNESVTLLLLIVLTIGFACGALFCHKVSKRRLELGVIAVGAFGFATTMMDVSFLMGRWQSSNGLSSVAEFLAKAQSHHLIVDFFLMSFSAGLYLVPLYTIIQDKSARVSRSRVIAANNVINAVFILIAAVIVFQLQKMDVATSKIFFYVSLVTFGVSFLSHLQLSAFAWRFLASLLARALYVIRVEGLDNIPTKGPCLLASNHVSFVDWLIIYGICPRPARFVMYYKYFDIPLVREIFKQGHVIPIAGRKEDPVIMEQAFVRMQEDLKHKQVVFIFPEGEVSHTGHMGEFKAGIVRIHNEAPCPVIPIALDGLWESVFSKKKQGFFVWLRHLFKPVYVSIGEPIPPEEFNLKLLEDHVRQLRK